VLIAPAIVQLSVGKDASAPIRYGIAGVAVIIIVTMVAITKRRDIAFGDDATDADEDLAGVDDDGAASTADDQAVRTDVAAEDAGAEPGLGADAVGDADDAEERAVTR
jgi:K(+)-stimulated pyrophosphate-energized sodium pump